MLSFGLLAAAEEKIDDLDDWSVESDSKDVEATTTKEVSAEGPKEPISHIQKIPRRGEKPLTPPSAPLERKRRDTTKEAGTKEKKRQNKNRQKDTSAVQTEGEAQDPTATGGAVHNGKVKKTRKPKASKKPKVQHNDDEQTQAQKEQRKAKKNKTRKPKEGRTRQERPRGNNKNRKNPNHNGHQLETSTV